MIFLTYIKERNEAVFYLLQFLCIFFICVFLLYELTSRVYIVSRINPYLLSIQRRYISNVRIKVYICNKWCRVTISTQLRIDILQVLCFLATLCGESHKFSASLNNIFSLLYAGISIISIGGSHRLNADRVVTAHVYSAYMDNGCLTALIIKYIHRY